MAPGRKDLRRVQFGWENPAAPGTQVVATARWRAPTDGIEDMLTVEQIPEHIGKFTGSDRSTVTAYKSQLALPETPATFEQLPYLLAISLGGPKAGVQDGAGTDYLYTTAIAEGTIPTIQTLTVEAGDDNQAYEFGYGHCPEFKLAGAGGETLKMSGMIMGQQKTTATFTAGVSLPTVEEVLVSKGKIYLDAISGAYGGTQIVAQVLAVDLNFKAFLIPKYTLDGLLDFTMVIYTGHEITGSILFENDTQAQAEILNYETQTARKLRLQFEGATVGTPGTTFSKKTLRIDLPIKFSRFGPLTDQEGNDTILGEFTSRYNTTADDSGSIVVVNELAALP